MPKSKSRFLHLALPTLSLVLLVFGTSAQSASDTPNLDSLSALLKSFEQKSKDIDPDDKTWIVPTQSEPLLVGVPTNLTKSTVREFIVNETLGAHEFYVIGSSGFFTLHLQLFSSDNQNVPEYQSTIKLSGSIPDATIPIGHTALFMKGQLMRVWTSSEEAKAQVTLTKASFIDLYFNQNIKVVSSLKSTFRFAVRTPPLFTGSPQNRIQFIMSSSINSQALLGNEQIAMYINRRPEWPTQKDFDCKTDGLLNNGVVKTLLPNSRFFCDTQDCVYKVVLEVSGIEAFEFFPTIMANKSRLTVEQSISLLEELEVGETVEYEFEVPVANSSWVFTLVPYDRGVQFYVHPGSRPGELSDFKYSISSTKKEQLILQGFGPDTGKASSFFVVYKAKDPAQTATFDFVLSAVPQDSPVQLQQNVMVQGTLAGSHITLFTVEQPVLEGDTVHTMFELEIVKGKADMMVRECSPFGIECALGSDDFKRLDKAVQLPDDTKQEQHDQTERKTVFSEQSNKQFLQMTLKSATESDDQHSKIQAAENRVFVLGVRNLDTLSSVETLFKLQAYGEGALTPLEPGMAASLKMDPKQTRRFSLSLSDSCKSLASATVEFRVIVVVGRFDVFFSSTSASPNEVDSIDQLRVHNPDPLAIRTVEHKKVLEMAKLDGASRVYFSVHSHEYSIFEVLPVVFCKSDDGRAYERVTDNALIHRKIDPADSSQCEEMQVKSGDHCYSKKFIFNIDSDSAFEEAAEEIRVYLTANVVTLKLCVIVLGPDSAGTPTCRIDSASTVVSFKKQLLVDEKAAAFILSVYTIVPAEFYLKKAIDFSLKLKLFSDSPSFELTRSGHLMVSSLWQAETEEFFVDLARVKRTVAVYLMSTDPSVVAVVSVKSKGDEYIMTTLTADQFGTRVVDVPRLRVEHCKVDCFLVIKVMKASMFSENFGVMFVKDNDPVVLHNGETLWLPNNSPQLLDFPVDPSDQQPLTLCVQNEQVHFKLVAKLIDPDVDSLLHDPWSLVSEDVFDFKTASSTDPQITVPANFFPDTKSHNLVFLLKPVSEVTVPPPSNNLIAFHITDRAVVNLHTSTMHLMQFMQTQSVVLQSDTVYFYFDKSSMEEFSLVLTLFSGEAHLILNDGSQVLPTMKRHWKSTLSSKGDEVMVSKGELESVGHNQGRFYVGVFGVSSAQFSVMLLPNFDNLIRLRYQRLSEFELDKNKSVYFSYFNVHPEFDTLMYAQGGDVDVQVLSYDPKETDFMSMVTNPENYRSKFTVLDNVLLHPKLADNSTNLATTTVIKVSAVSGLCRLGIGVFNSSVPLQLLPEKRVGFEQAADQTTTFMTLMESNYEDIEINLIVQVGTVRVQFSDRNKEFSEAAELTAPADQSFDCKADSDSSRLVDIVLIKSIYVKVHSKTPAKYSLLILPKDKFKEVKTGVPEVITTSTNKDVFVYHLLSKRHAESLTAFAISVEEHQTFKETPDMLFVPQSDTVLNPDSPFLPMPLVDVFEEKKSDFIHTEIVPEFVPGYYVLKFKATTPRQRVRVSVSYNNTKSIEPNSFTKQVVANAVESSHSFVMFVHKAGELFLALESCSDFEIDDLRFHGQVDVNRTEVDADTNKYSYDPKTDTTAIQADKSVAQTFDMLRFKDSGLMTATTLEVLHVPSVRLFITQPGLLRFKVHTSTPKAGRNPSAVAQELTNYRLLTEHRPFEKELILKDYLQLFNSEEDLRELKLGHKTSKVSGELVLNMRVPNFKPQFSVDFPDVRAAVMKLHFFVASDPEFPRMLDRCGVSCLDLIRHSQHTVSFNFTQKDIRQFQSHHWLQTGISLVQLEAAGVDKIAHVFCQLSVHAYLDDDDLNGIGYNQKYAVVPYFLMSVPYGRQPRLLLYFGFVLLAAFIVFAVWGILDKRKRSMEVINRSEPSNVFDSIDSSNIEISSITKN